MYNYCTLHYCGSRVNGCSQLVLPTVTLLFPMSCKVCEFTCVSFPISALFVTFIAVTLLTLGGYWARQGTRGEGSVVKN